MPGIAQPAGTTPSAGDLWGQVKPCWDRSATVASVPVTLITRLGGDGRLAKPPTIVRPPAAVPDQARLKSEARAIAAVIGRMPYKGPLLGEAARNLEIRFMPASHAGRHG
jgi:hypothetical protein